MEEERRKLSDTRRKTEFLNVADNVPDLDYIENAFSHVSTIDPSVRDVILYCRVSGREQARNRNLDQQITNETDTLELLGIKVVKCFSETCSGKQLDRKEFIAAIAYARENYLPIVARSTCRYLRHPDFWSSRDENYFPTRTQVNELVTFAKNVKLFTRIEPTASKEKVRSEQIKQGQKMKHKRGRPRKTPKRKRRPFTPEEEQRIVELNEKGLSNCCIARDLDRNESSIRSKQKDLKARESE